MKQTLLMCCVVILTLCCGNILPDTTGIAVAARPTPEPGFQTADNEFTVQYSDAGPLTFRTHIQSNPTTGPQDPFTYTSTIKVYDANSSLLQEITYTGYAAMQVNTTRKDMLDKLILQNKHCSDINFDGYPDITPIIYSYGFIRRHAGYVWNAQTRSFTPVPNMNVAVNPLVDVENKKLRGMEFHAPHGSRYSIYAVENGELVTTNQLEFQGHPIQYGRTPGPAPEMRVSVEFKEYRLKRGSLDLVRSGWLDTKDGAKNNKLGPLWEDFIEANLYQ